jgi:hypothetical protein
VQNLSSEEPVPAFYYNYLRTNDKVMSDVTSWNAQQVRDKENAGGASIVSEVMSAEVLSVLYGAKNVRTEMEIEYLFSNWKIADFIVEMFDERVGVSVTRAMGYPDESTFDEEEALRLLNKKIVGLVLARNGVSDRDSFYKSVLHVFAQSERIAHLLHKQFNTLDETVKDNVVVICTVAERSPHLYENSWQYR